MMGCLDSDQMPECAVHVRRFAVSFGPVAPRSQSIPSSVFVPPPEIVNKLSLGSLGNSAATGGSHSFRRSGELLGGGSFTTAGQVFVSALRHHAKILDDSLRFDPRGKVVGQPCEAGAGFEVGLKFANSPTSSLRGVRATLGRHSFRVCRRLEGSGSCRSVGIPNCWRGRLVQRSRWRHRPATSAIASRSSTGGTVSRTTHHHVHASFGPDPFAWLRRRWVR